MRKILLYIRIKDWWSFIIPPVLSFYFAGLLCKKTKDSNLSDILSTFIIFFLLTCFTAAFGFFLNEWTDIKDDKIAGKENVLYTLSKNKIRLICFVILAGIILSSLFISWNIYTLILLHFQLILFILYSVYPFRLKRKKYPAIIIDALYSGTVFYLMAFLIATGSGVNRSNIFLLTMLFFWAVLRGIRNIIHHLIQDKTHDEKLNLKTIATTNNELTLKKHVQYFLFPVELLSYILFLYLLPYSVVLICSFLVFLLYTANREKYIIPFLWKRKAPIETNFMTEINMFYEIILPFLFLSILTYNDSRIIILFFISLIFFTQLSIKFFLTKV